ncbi:MAG: hypothetical protein E6K75_03310 [Candidatus Eisenbacteria bacterium]|uniref:DUF1761 domain-containing protein n=1 Tax=Eiseniibacteriota bacterium TaxID=2212470 RepID=A0A538T968_UNCEI|nr:MAG: hypothetical protein E6K75_03310 [Candidatus Eisenbacteria bacterium]
MARINTGRVILGGLLAGLVINVVSVLCNFLLVGKKIMQAQQAGHFLAQPRFPFLPAWLILMFLVGIALVWLYAAVRPRLGPGPGTALKVGILVGLLMGVPDNMANAAWGTSGRYLPAMWMLEHLIGCALGTLVGAWLYKEEP